MSRTRTLYSRGRDEQTARFEHFLLFSSDFSLDPLDLSLGISQFLDRCLPLDPDYIRYPWVGDLARMREELGFEPAYTAEEIHAVPCESNFDTYNVNKGAMGLTVTGQKAS